MNKLAWAIFLFIIIILASTCGCIDNKNNKKKEDATNHIPVISLISPKGGESFTYHSTWIDIEILWNATDKDNDDLRIDIFYSHNRTEWSVINLNETNDGKYLWSDHPDAGKYYVKVVAKDDESSAEAVTNQTIDIFGFPMDSPEYIEVVTPNGGEIWSGIQNITWLTGFVGISASITLYDDVLNHKYLIADGFFIKNYTKISNESLCYFHVDTSKFDNGHNYRIKIEHDYRFNDTSDNYFSIYNEQESSQKYVTYGTNFSLEKIKIADKESDSSYVRSMAVSHDNRIVIWLETNSKTVNYTIFCSNTNGSNYKKIYVLTEYISELHFTFDDKKIIFISNKNAYEIDLDGENKTLFLRDVNELYIINEFEFIVERHTNVSFVNESNVTKYQHHRNLVYVNNKINLSINLTNYYDSGPDYGYNNIAEWYISGVDINLNERYIIYSLDFDDGIIERGGRGHKDFESGIYKVNFDGSNPVCIYKREDLWGVKFNPNCSKILFHSGAWAHDNPIWVMDANGENVTQLTNLQGPRNYEGTAYFIGNGAGIIYDNYIEGEKSRNIWMTNLDGSIKTRLTQNGLFYQLLLIGPNQKDIYYLKDGEIWLMYYI
jgi:Tol biopolymer transport system component